MPVTGTLFSVIENIRAAKRQAFEVFLARLAIFHMAAGKTINTGYLERLTQLMAQLYARGDIIIGGREIEPDKFVKQTRHHAGTDDIIFFWDLFDSLAAF